MVIVGLWWEKEKSWQPSKMERKTTKGRAKNSTLKMICVEAKKNIHVL